MNNFLKQAQTKSEYMLIMQVLTMGAIDPNVTEAEITQTVFDMLTDYRALPL